jgi:hypothetical protein
MDLFTALIFTDDDSQPGKAGDSRLFRILLWIGGIVVFAGAVLLLKSASTEWRVTHMPSLSTQYERQQVDALVIPPFLEHAKSRG